MSGESLTKILCERIARFRAGQRQTQLADVTHKRPPQTSQSGGEVDTRWAETLCSTAVKRNL
eukprot:4601221-Prorocentrum_lima.AAC.1